MAETTGSDGAGPAGSPETAAELDQVVHQMATEAEVDAHPPVPTAPPEDGLYHTTVVDEYGDTRNVTVDYEPFQQFVEEERTVIHDVEPVRYEDGHLSFDPHDPEAVAEHGGYHEGVADHDATSHDSDVAEHPPEAHLVDEGGGNSE